MPLIDLSCHFGIRPETLALPQSTADQAKAYADRLKIEAMCFSSGMATFDLEGGNNHLSELLQQDQRFRGWLTLSQHQPDLSNDLAHRFLTKTNWVGAAFVQQTDGDAIHNDTGLETLNSLRRFNCPVLVTVSTAHTLEAAIAAAKAIGNMRFIVAPQSSALTNNTIPAIKSLLNMSLLPSIQYAERDVIAQAVESLSERRVLWGSDWGMCNPTAALGMIKDSAITSPQRRRITYDNAKQLLK